MGHSFLEKIKIFKFKVFFLNGNRIDQIAHQTLLEKGDESNEF